MTRTDCLDYDRSAVRRFSRASPCDPRCLSARGESPSCHPARSLLLKWSPRARPGSPGPRAFLLGVAGWCGAGFVRSASWLRSGPLVGFFFSLALSLPFALGPLFRWSLWLFFVAVAPLLGFARAGLPGPPFVRVPAGSSGLRPCALLARRVARFFALLARCPPSPALIPDCGRWPAGATRRPARLFPRLRLVALRAGPPPGYYPSAFSPLARFRPRALLWVASCSAFGP